jgi:hypothetical protein
MQRLAPRIVAAVVCAVAVLFVYGAVRAHGEGRQLLANPTFDARAGNWGFRHAAFAPGVHHGASGAARLEGVQQGINDWSDAGVIIGSPPTNQRLRFTCFVKGTVDGQRVYINAFTFDKTMKPTGYWHSEAIVAAGGWTPMEVTVNALDGSARLTAWVINETANPVYVSDARLVAGRKEHATPHFVRAIKRPVAGLGGPGVIRATAQASVQSMKPGDTGVVTFPVPGTYRDQVPLSFDLRVTPPSALRGSRLLMRPDGINRICEVTVAPPDAGAKIRWESLVLVGDRKQSELPHAAVPEVPKDAAAWTRAAACVQSDDPAIKAKADELAKGTDGIESYVRKVIAFTSRNQGRPGVRFDSLDARKALDCGGSCTSRANLAAALLRARGIPARTVAHLPTWAGPLFEHWLVEYWHPGAGWVWVESTKGQMQPSPNEIVVLNVANPEDEDRAFDPIHVRYVAPGAAYLSACELSKELVHAQTTTDATNAAVPLVRIAGSPAELSALFDAAATRYRELAAAGERGRLDAAGSAGVLAAARSGRASDLMAALKVAR